MTIAMFRAKVRRLKIGKFRMLKPGELVEAHDLQIGVNYYDWIAEHQVGQAVNKTETILRLWE